MKKIERFGGTKIIFFISFFFSIILLSCDNPVENDPEKLFGTWFNEDSGIYTEESHADTLFYTDRLEIQFIPPNITKTERKIFETGTNIFLGYRYRGEGTFYVSGNRLNMFTDKAAYNDDEVSFYSTSLELIPIRREPERVTYKINMNILQFIYPPCPPNANCIGSQSFFRSSY
ncbi:MAG TPA: hypothetical protein VMT35_18765 [Ignavibacteriaceae bacterium]|nr:hypothetical protein [Ignavibacteriaceae bacterium]